MIYGLVHALDYWKQSERLQYPWQPAFKKCFSRREKEERKKKQVREGKKQRGRAADRFNDTNCSAVVRAALTADGLRRRRIQSVALLSLFLFLSASFLKGLVATREIQVF